MEVNQLANAFVVAGLQPGDRMAMLSKNSIEYAVMYFAASKAGIVPVPVNYRLAADAWAYIMNDAQAKLVMASAAYVDAVNSFRGELQTATTFISIGAGAVDGWLDYRSWIEDRPATPPIATFASTMTCTRCTRAVRWAAQRAVLTYGAVSANLTQVEPIARAAPGERFLIVGAALPRRGRGDGVLVREVGRHALHPGGFQPC